MSNFKIEANPPRFAVGDRVMCQRDGKKGMAGLDQGVVYTVQYASEDFVELKGICRIFKPTDFYLAPQPEEPNDTQETLRDKFAMAALTGLLASGRFGQEESVTDAYYFADKMLYERNKK